MQSEVATALTREEVERYDRQIRLLGLEGQEKLKKSRILVVGIGGLGSPVSIYLTAAGVGELILVDPGIVELSNLNRQILHWTRDIGRYKTSSAQEKLFELNPNVKITVYPLQADESLLENLVPGVDLVIDALDNWETRLVLNKICVKHRKPLIHGGVSGFYGQVLVVIPGITPCLNCIISTVKKTHETIPVIGPTPGVIAMIQVTEAIKILTGVGKPALNKLIVYNGYNMEFHVLDVSRNPKCPVCSGI